VRFAPAVRRLAGERLFAPPFGVAAATRRFRRLAPACLAAALLAAFLFLVRAAFFAAALLLAFDAAIVSCSHFITSYVVQVSSFSVNYIIY
jgi:hypothetical protein